MIGRSETPRDGDAVDALVVDRYLDALLAAAERHADDAPADAALAPEVRDAARLLRRALVRVHPSFLFEERLAARLAAFAVAQGRDAGARDVEAGAVDDASAVVPFGRLNAAPEAADPWLAAILAGDADPADEATMPDEPRLMSARRPLIVGGALTSAAISIVGVAWVAWRASRASAGQAVVPMPGAGRKPHPAAPATVGLSSGGVGGPA